jgi:cell division protein FtsI/penicillin-binding protein 2
MNFLNKDKEPGTRKEQFNRLRWRRLNFILIFMTAGFIAVIIKLAYLQLLQGEALAMKAERQHRRLIDIHLRFSPLYHSERALLSF